MPSVPGFVKLESKGSHKPRRDFILEPDYVLWHSGELPSPQAQAIGNVFHINDHAHPFRRAVQLAQYQDIRPELARDTLQGSLAVGAIYGSRGSHVKAPEPE